MSDDRADHADHADYAREADMLDGYHAEDIIQEAMRRIRAEEETDDE